MTPTSHPAPVVLEAAISPLRDGRQLQTTEELIDEARQSLAAGAGVIHHHHNFRLTRDEAVAQVLRIQREVLATFPHACLYNDYLRGEQVMAEKNAHLPALAHAGLLTMAALDPGLTQFAVLDEDGLPSRHRQGGADYAAAHEVVAFARRTGAALSIGIYDPSNLRWTLAYEARGMFPAGSVIKLYFGGQYLINGAPTAGFGLPPTRQSLDMYLSMMAGSTLPWVVSIQGGVLLESELARYALERGGHLRVGIEDMAGLNPMTNRETVEAAAALAAEVGRPVATGAEAKAVLRGIRAAAA
ncbi:MULTISPECIES: 3-keto-5-aminohexanoate cleavage protein [Frankia]|nr:MULTISPECIES: 3-keto-5-aminohexanoate cleavage protein [Frankia]